MYLGTTAQIDPPGTRCIDPVNPNLGTHPLSQRPVPGFLWPLMSIFRFSALAPSTDREVPSQLYGTSHTFDWWRAAAVWGSALPGGWGGKRGCSKGPGHCPHPNGAWAAGGVAKEAPGLRVGAWWIKDEELCLS